MQLFDENENIYVEDWSGNHWWSLVNHDLVHAVDVNIRKNRRFVHTLKLMHSNVL